MKLLDKDLLAKIPPLYSTETIPLDEKTFVAKFCTTHGNPKWKWYVVEGNYDEEEYDFVFFGLVDGFEQEWGYFTLGELKALGLNGKPLVERDLSFVPTKVKDCRELQRRRRAI